MADVSVNCSTGTEDLKQFKLLISRMNEFDSVERKAIEWLEPLAGDAGPCGQDLESHNDFLALTLAAAGKPETQFSPAKPADWRSVMEMAEALFERTLDLRIAILWLRGGLNLWGYRMLPVGLKLLCGLIDRHWETLHPLPDPDDGDPYARVNALLILREINGLVGDIRGASMIEDRSIGEFRARSIELALGLAPARSEEKVVGKEQVLLMMAAAVTALPAVREQCQEALTQTRRLMSLLNDKLNDRAPDLRPLHDLVKAIAGTLPPEEVSLEEEPTMAETQTLDEAPVTETVRIVKQSGLSGTISSRDEAIRAIDMICEYLERTEPTNPAPLFLRRARQLINHNFLQLMKVLAPDALAGVAGLVGINPDDIEDPNES